MNKLKNLKKKTLLLVVAAVLYAVSFLAVAWIASSDNPKPQLTAENVARFYVAGVTGLDVQVVGKEDVSEAIGAEEAYVFTLSAKGVDGEATILVAKSNGGGWIILQG
jgi:hypothetical protein